MDNISIGQRRLNDLRPYLQGQEISEFNGRKSGFKVASLAFLRQLVKDLDSALAERHISIIDKKVSFSSSGPAVAGNPTLYFMTDQNRGLAVFIIPGNSGEPTILLRHITSMKDYRGGPNMWLSDVNPYERLLNHMFVETIAPPAAP